MLKIKDLEIGRWAGCNPKGSYKMNEGGSIIKGDMTVDTEIRVMHT